MNPDHAILFPIVLVNEDAQELTFLHERLLEAGVENPMVTFSERETVLDYLEAVCIAAAPRLTPCLMFLDFRLPEIPEMIAWARTQPLLQKLKIVVLSDEELETQAVSPAPFGADHGLARFPTLVALAAIVACACARGIGHG